MALQATIKQTKAPTWEPAPRILELSPGEVHLWRGRLSLKKDEVAELWPRLSEKEQTRASRFHFPEDSDRYILTRGMLRDILLRYQTLVATPLCISVRPTGQPYLLHSPDGPGLRFNLSHSRSLVLFAITLDRKVGIDVEPVSNGTDWQTIASRFFSALECQYLLALPTPEREQAFLSLWTRKEAYVKAKGEGLSIPLDSFSILASLDGTLQVDDSAEPSARRTWSFLSVTPDEHHFGTVAMEGNPSHVLFWDYNLMRSVI
jgi:4'-phosphopantetheinyl transferase